jgi:hypothetical protein
VIKLVLPNDIPVSFRCLAHSRFSCLLCSDHGVSFRSVRVTVDQPVPRRALQLQGSPSLIIICDWLSHERRLRDGTQALNSSAMTSQSGSGDRVIRVDVALRADRAAAHGAKGYPSAAPPGRGALETPPDTHNGTLVLQNGANRAGLAPGSGPLWALIRAIGGRGVRVQRAGRLPILGHVGRDNQPCGVLPLPFQVPGIGIADLVQVQPVGGPEDVPGGDVARLELTLQIPHQSHIFPLTVLCLSGCPGQPKPAARFAPCPTGVCVFAGTAVLAAVAGEAAGSAPAIG